MMYPEHESAALNSAKGYEAAEYLGMENLHAVDSAQPRQGINFSPIKRLIQRNWLLIAVPTVLAAGVTATIILLSPQTYSGRFQALVEPVNNDARLSQPVLSEGANLSPPEMDYLSLISVFKSRKVLDGVVAKIDDKYPEVTYDVLNDALEVERIEKSPAEKTKILNVTYESTDQSEILDVLKALQADYLKFLLEDRNSQINSSLAFIEQQLPGLKRRVSTLEGQLQVLQQQYRISDLDSEGAELAQQSRQMQAQQLEAQRDLAAQKSLYSNLQQQLGGLTPKDAVNASSLSENPRYQALLSQLKQLESQIATESAQFQPEYPGLQTLQEQRNNLVKLLRQESQKLVGNAAVPQFQTSIQKTMSQQLVDTLNQVQVLEIRNQALGQANAAIDQQVRQFPEIKRRYNDLQAQLEIARNTLKQLQLKRESLRVDIAQKDSLWQMIVNPELVRDAQGNLVASSRKGLQKVLLGTLGGLLLGLGCAILREKRRDVFYSLDDLQEDMKWPVVGALPLSDKPSRQLMEVGSAEDDLRQDPSALMESAEELYTNIRFLPLEPGVRSLVITSGVARDGKTTVTAYLAKAAASMGQRVLVVDANMTMPQVHMWLDVPNFEGLNEVLTKSIDPHQLIQRSPYQTNLFVLPSGQISPASRKLMASQQMQHLMSQLHSMFDLVLYDTLPLQNAPDANFMARNADGMLIVVSVGKTRRSLLLRLLKKVQSNRIPVLGIVANQVKNLSEVKAAEMGSMAGDVEDEFEMFRVPSSQN